jgi:thioredoxin 1
MSVICICGFCIPYSVLWPFLLIVLKPIYDWVSKLFGFQPLKVDNKQSHGHGCEGGSCPFSPKKDTKHVGVEGSKSTAGVIHVDSEEHFESLTSSASITVVKFTASWCKPCQRIEPHFQKLAEEHGSTATFVKVDVDSLDKVAAECGALRIPMFAAFKDGKRIKTVNTDKEEDLSSFIIGLL